MSLTATTSAVLGKRKTRNPDYVLQLASSPEPQDLTAPSDSDFEPLREPSSSKDTPRPILVNGKLISNTKKCYKCTFEGCDKTYTKPSRLEEHERSHTGERPFICQTCKKSYLRETHLQAHQRSHLPDSDKPLVCSESGCSKRFWTQQHLRAHLDWHKGARSFKCTEPDCMEVFAKHHQLRTHICTVHAPPGTKPYRCEHEGCDKSFSMNQHLRTHMKVHNEKRYTCVQASCTPSPGVEPVYYPTWTALQHHLRTAHPPTCPYPSCNGRKFTAQKGLRAHLKLHQERELEAQIDAAAAGSDAEDDLLPPKKKRRGGEIGRDWKCEMSGCGKDFKSNKALQTHNKVTHLGRRDFVCPHETCKSAFGYKHLLQRHLAKIHKSGSGSDQPLSGNDGEDDESNSDDDDSDTVQNEVTDDFSIDAITGHAYASRAKERLKNCKAIQCPYPNFDNISFKTLSTSSESQPGNGNKTACKYVFSRAYDLRRHLLAEHDIDASKESVDAWVAIAKNTSRTGQQELL
ncbi:hypothetical protein K435DRAFT_816192 [Dendrothele bispora CBS 962.96]|uniref:C2H2-type domain-containing protein n=1 Tax=Dendrothele bispora (strain CBS 962.96) TaxID=1314807 RepID=A0A4S8MSH9_DENBC|nr:hypothetical protein K435DRAFT_816192 [Dendrothele bispora CBS 962.96]